MSTNVQSTSASLTEPEYIEETPWLYYISIALVIVGLVLTSYLAYVKLTPAEAYCAESGTFDCNSVQSSVYSEIMGIPISVLGLGAYLAMFGLLVLENRNDFVFNYGRMALFGMTLFGVIYSAYLTYIEAFVLETWCLWCVGSALLMVSLFTISTLRAFADPYEYIDEE